MSWLVKQLGILRCCWRQHRGYLRGDWENGVLVILEAMKATGNMPATDLSWLKYGRRGWR